MVRALMPESDGGVGHFCAAPAVLWVFGRRNRLGVGTTDSDPDFLLMYRCRASWLAAQPALPRRGNCPG